MSALSRDYYSFCDLQGCGEKIQERGEEYRIVRPEDTAAVGADVYCSVNCAKISLMREERGHR